MAEVIKLPRMSDTMEEGNIVAWHKKVGDHVKSGDVLADVETDKATMELESYNDGVLLYIAVEKGKVPVNGVIAVIGKKGEDYKAVLSKEQTIAPAKTQTKSAPMAAGEALTPAEIEKKFSVTLVRMPLMSDTMTEGKIVAWTKNVGDAVKDDDVLAEVETDKATMELVGYASGTLLYQDVPAGKAAKVNSVVAIVGDKKAKIKDVLSALSLAESGATKTATPAKTSTPANTAPAISATTKASAAADGGHIKASPLARMIASQKHINLAKVQGTGDGGRIVKRDVENLSADATSPRAASVSAAESGVRFEDMEVTTMRGVIAKRLSESKQNSPHFYLTVAVNMGKVARARKRINEMLKTKISFNDIVMKATALALKKYPMVNASWRGDFIRVNYDVNIAVAISVPDGLLVPVVRNTDKKTLAEISAEIKTLAQKAKDKKLQPEDWADSTFTISNLGMYGIDSFTAIINAPNAAILAVSAIIEKPIVENGQIVVGQMMNLTLSADHRVIDGVLGAEFLQTLKNYLEEPIMML